MKVSVAMMTYNHERFVAQAIESVLMQETDFDYELVIGEDCSTDQTREIVVDFQTRFPERIRLLLPERNIGSQENFAQTLRACTGEYVALLEGDDFWTSPHKIQKQVEFLNAHPTTSMCFHLVQRLSDQDESASCIWPEDPPEFSTVENLLLGMYIPTCSVVMRRACVDLPAWLRELRIGDWPICILLAERGKIACLRETMATYRLHAGGIWSTLDSISRTVETIKMYNYVNAHLGYKYGKVIYPILAQQYFELAAGHDQAGDAELARAYLKKNLGTQLLSRQRPTLNQLKMAARLTFPSLYSFSKRMLKARE